MKTIAVILIGLSGMMMGYGQSIGISETSLVPEESAILDIRSTSKGVLIPRMTLEQRDLIVEPATGLLINQIDGTAGMYIYTGSSWQHLPHDMETWGTTGNTGTDPNTQFIGTTDNQPIRFRLNNTWAGELNHMSGNAMIGDSSGMGIVSAHSNTAFGHRALTSLTTGNRNVAVGYAALRSLQSGGHNIGIGYHALMSTTAGELNIALGSYALEKNSSGFYNLSIGAFSMANNTTAGGNTAVGHYALISSVSGSYNTAVGLDVLFENNTGHSNTGMGAGALYANTDGHNNLALGRQALNTNTTGEYNIALGTSALEQNTTGDYNIAIGFETGTQADDLYNTVSISNNGSLQSIDNRVKIGNTAHTWTGGNVTWSTYSDARIKRNIHEDVKGLDFITRLRPVTYYRDIDVQAALTGNQPLHDFPHKYDIEDIQFSGFLAQEVEVAAAASGYSFSGLTAPQGEHDLYTLSYESFVVPLVKAVQEQQAIIEQQQVQLSKQDEEFKVQRQMFDELINRYVEIESRLRAFEHQKTEKK